MLSKRMLLTVALGAVLFAPAGAHGEDNKALVRRWIEQVIAKGNAAAVGDFLAPTFVAHMTVGPDLKGPDSFGQRITALHTAFPDVRYTIEDMVAEGDKVAVRLTAHGTHKGDFLGVAPSGKALTWTQILIFHIANGKFQEAWQMSDLGRQLGLVSAQGQSKP